MNDRGWDEDAARPYFFLSYAHTPRAGVRGAGDPNLWVRKLFRDLCEAVLEQTTVPAGVPVGFMDEDMHQGELWAGRLSKELARCRVFVPLYSPRYFNSVPCGQEWYCFTRRPVFPATLSSVHTSGIVPVLWAPMSRYALPEVANELQFNHASFGLDYVSEGLCALMKLSDFRNAYEVAVHRLARRIVEVAEETVIPVGRELDFNAQPSAFPVNTPTKQLRISVLSYHQGELPPDRNPDFYGPARTDWHPYRPAATRSLADQAARVARQLGFQPTVHEFDDEVDSLVAGGPPAAPGLLLLDRWALRDEQRRDLVRRFDRSDADWISVMEPWNTDDPDSAEAHDRLGELSRIALRITHKAGRPSFHGALGGPVAGLESEEAFDDALPAAAMKAKWAFERRTKREPDRPPRSRPDLRGAFRPGGGRDGPDPFGEDGSTDPDHPDDDADFDHGDRPDGGAPPGGGKR